MDRLDLTVWSIASRGVHLQHQCAPVLDTHMRCGFRRGERDGKVVRRARNAPFNGSIVGRGRESASVWDRRIPMQWRVAYQTLQPQLVRSHPGFWPRCAQQLGEREDQIKCAVVEVARGLHRAFLDAHSNCLVQRRTLARSRSRFQIWQLLWASRIILSLPFSGGSARKKNELARTRNTDELAHLPHHPQQWPSFSPVFCPWPPPPPARLMFGQSLTSSPRPLSAQSSPKPRVSSPSPRPSS